MEKESEISEKNENVRVLTDDSLDDSNKNLFFFEYNKNVVLPISIFNNGSLSALESISKYLKENLGLKYNEISALLNRDQRTIWDAYNESKKKMQEKFFLDSSSCHIPVNVLFDRKLSVLESIVSFLKEDYNLRYSQIAGLINRDQRTVWTVYSRSRKKKEK